MTSETFLLTVPRAFDYIPRFLKDFNFPAPVIDFVRYHHEKIDGTGCPLELKSYHIPLGAKIIRVSVNIAAMS